MKILLVDDDPISRRIATAILVKLECGVTVAQNGREALEQVDAAWDIVLMDCRMPEMDGPTAAREWRARERHRVPIIALTAATETEDFEIALLAGMDDLVNKPVSLNTLSRVLDKWGRVPGEEVPDAERPSEKEAGPGLLEDFLGFEGVLKSMLGTFLRVIPEEMDQLGAAVHSGDVNSAAQLAHKIKGQLKTFHEMESGDLAGRLEFAADRGEATDLSGHYDGLLASLPPSLARLNGLFEHLNA